jgi:hypothetical protein
VGAPAQDPGAHIAYVAADLTDGGPNGVGVGLKEAATVLGWTVDVYDGRGTAQGHTNAINQAIASNPRAIVLGSVDATEQASTIKAANNARIPVFGWHSTATPGPGLGLATNISTDPLQVAKLAAAYAVADSDGHAGAAIFTDSQYAVAIAKSDAMRALPHSLRGLHGPGHRGLARLGHLTADAGPHLQPAAAERRQVDLLPRHQRQLLHRGRPGAQVGRKEPGRAAEGHRSRQRRRRRAAAHPHR